MKQFGMQMKFRVGHVVAALWACLFILLIEFIRNFYKFRKYLDILEFSCHNFGNFVHINYTHCTHSNTHSTLCECAFLCSIIYYSAFVYMAQMFDKEAGKCFSILCYVPKGSIYCTQTHTQSHV